MTTRIRIALALSLAVALPAALAQVPTAPGQWDVRAPLPQPRTEVSMASDGARLYLAAGFSPIGGNPTATPRELFAYDPEADSWSELTQLPEGLDHATMTYLDGRLYVIGGYLRTTPGLGGAGVTDAVRIYEIAADEWTDGTPMPTARGALAVALHEGRLHAIGGVDAGGRNTGAHEVYDPATDTWSTAAHLPTPRDHHAAAAVAGEIVVLAGRNPTGFTLRINEIYDPATDSWREGAPVPTGRSGIAATVLDGLVYLFGGEDNVTRSTFAEAERYDVAADGWESLPDMPTSRHGLGAAVLDGRIHVVSGGPGVGLTFSGVHELLTVDGD